MTLRASTTCLGTTTRSSGFRHGPPTSEVQSHQHHIARDRDDWDSEHETYPEDDPCKERPAWWRGLVIAREAVPGIDEVPRHRHRYEFNNKYKVKMETNGLIVSATTPNGRLVEIIELADHPWFVGCQFHPEFKSKPDQAHPLFRDFIKAALVHKVD